MWKRKWGRVMEIIECPCVDCVCVVMCKFKSYTRMYWDCLLIRNYIHAFLLASADDGSDPSPFQLMYDILKPTTWRVIGGNVDKMKEE